MSEDNWYDEGIGSESHIRKTMKSYNEYQPPSINKVLKDKKPIKEEEE